MEKGRKFRKVIVDLSISLDKRIDNYLQESEAEKLERRFENSVKHWDNQQLNETT